MKTLSLAKISYWHWIEKKTALENLVDIQYEVPNGLLGMLRNVVLRLCGCLTKGEESPENPQRMKDLRALVGTCDECYGWKSHPYFAKIRRPITEKRFEITVVTTELTKIFVKATDKIESIKKGVGLENESALYMKDLLLENYRPCYYYKILDGMKSVVGIASPKAGSKLIIISSFNYNYESVSMIDEDEELRIIVLQLMERGLVGEMPDKILYDCNILDWAKTLKDCAIPNHAKLCILPKPRGGG